MSLDELKDKMASYSWEDILKALPFEGGPSSTKFVYLASAFVVMASAFFLVLVVGGVYAHSKDHHSDVAMNTLIISLMGSVVALSAHAHIKRNALMDRPDTGKDNTQNGPDPK